MSIGYVTLDQLKDGDRIQSENNRTVHLVRQDEHGLFILVENVNASGFSKIHLTQCMVPGRGLIIKGFYKHYKRPSLSNKPTSTKES